VRTVADGGRSYFFSGDLGTTLPALWQQCVALQCGGQTRAAA